MGARYDEEVEPEEKAKPRNRVRKVFLLAVLFFGVGLIAESFLPPRYQPSARASVGLIRVYQSIGSPSLRAVGVQCRYTPTCSHYAVDAIEYYGTLRGIAKTAGRLWRCSPWGGAGYDPATPSGEPTGAW
jgi:putative membrane protein insertion efficiency factor